LTGLSWTIRLVAILPARLASDLVDLLPVRNKGAAQATSTISTGPDVLDIFARDELRGSPTVGRSEGLVVREQELSRVKSSVRGNLVQLALKREAELVQVKIVLIVREGILNFLSDFQKTENEERGKGCARDR